MLRRSSAASCSPSWRCCLSSRGNLSKTMSARVDAEVDSSQDCDEASLNEGSEPPGPSSSASVVGNFVSSRCVSQSGRPFLLLPFESFA